jgi:hypothetical protein
MRMTYGKVSSRKNTSKIKLSRSLSLSLSLSIKKQKWRLSVLDRFNNGSQGISSIQRPFQGPGWFHDQVLGRFVSGQGNFDAKFSFSIQFSQEEKCQQSPNVQYDTSERVL